LPRDSDTIVEQFCKWRAIRVSEQSNRSKAFRRSGLIIARIDSQISSLRITAPVNIGSLQYVAKICPG